MNNVITDFERPYGSRERVWVQNEIGDETKDITPAVVGQNLRKPSWSDYPRTKP
ncbi:MAG TPA: hypothetical protein VIS71_06500 [Terrimicrobium sp.]